MENHGKSEPPGTGGFLWSVASGIAAMVFLIVTSVLIYPIIFIVALAVVVLLIVISPDSTSSKQETPDRHDPKELNVDIPQVQNNQKLNERSPRAEPPHPVKAPLR